MNSLPQAQWRDAAGLKAIASALTVDGTAPLAVGGAVRDSLLGLPVSDVDLATPLIPQNVIERLQAVGIKAIPTGIDHGTITAVAGGQNYEITSFRRDVSTDGRRAIVAFSADWAEDAKRRDFTINALYADIVSGEIFDSVGGLADLEKRHVRFIGNASERIAEDHLRILRYFRFLARFGESRADEAALSACAAARGSLKSLSRERIASELTRLLALPRPELAVQLMIDSGIFEAFMPELAVDANDRMLKLVKKEACCSVAPSMAARLLSLLPPVAETVEAIARRLKFSNRLRKDLLIRIAEQNVGPANIRALAYHHGIEAARDAAMLFAGDGTLDKCLTLLGGWLPPAFRSQRRRADKNGASIRASRCRNIASN